MHRRINTIVWLGPPILLGRVIWHMAVSMCSPALLRWAISFLARNLISCGSRTWCPQAYPPSPCVHTHRPEGAWKHTPLQALICTKIICTIYHLICSECNNNLEVEAVALPRAIFPNRLHMPRVHMGSDLLEIYLIPIQKTKFVPTLALGLALQGSHFHQLKICLRLLFC